MTECLHLNGHQEAALEKNAKERKRNPICSSGHTCGKATSDLKEVFSLQTRYGSGLNLLPEN